MTARLVEVSADDVSVDMAVEATYEQVDDMTLVHFRPAT